MLSQIDNKLNLTNKILHSNLIKFLLFCHNLNDQINSCAKIDQSQVFQPLSLV